MWKGASVFVIAVLATQAGTGSACQGHDECPSDQYCAIDNK
eukprot:gene30786-26873_t